MTSAGGTIANAPGELKLWDVATGKQAGSWGLQTVSQLLCWQSARILLQ
jgi:hypothetical protein